MGKDAMPRTNHFIYLTCYESQILSEEIVGCSWGDVLSSILPDERAGSIPARSLVE